MKHVGIDIGGTFTDLVEYDDESGELGRAKAPTTSSRPEEAFLSLFSARGVPSAELGDLVHATTIVTNLIVERAGARVGLITTRGFRDVLEIGRSYRPDLYDTQWVKPQPMVPRPWRLEVDERVGADGEIIRPPDPDEVRAVAGELLSQGIDAIAICFMNAFLNPSNERAARDAVQELDCSLALSISSDVDPRIREYERTSTTVLNVYAKPNIEKYIGRLDASIEAESQILYMQSSGGMVSGSYAVEFPVQLLYSGPAAGVIAGSVVGRSIGASNVCTMDMGGTSTDVCVIRDGQPTTRDTVEPEWGIPARTRSFDINAIGAGGGSVVAVDDGGALRVGPQSLGAEPGPACYGRGGRIPTVTDANLLLGLINPKGLLDGAMRLSMMDARTAFEPVADQLGVSVRDVVLGTYRIVNADMAQAVRRITVGVGLDPRDFVLVAFGGAGGQHAAEVSKENEISTVGFPRNASTLSALGLLAAEVSNSVSKAVLQELDPGAASSFDDEYSDLTERATTVLASAGQSTSIRVSRWAEMRYVGQAHELMIPVSHGGIDAVSWRESFEREHHRLYGVRLGDPIEVVNLGVTVAKARRPFELREFFPDSVDTNPVAKRDVLFEEASVEVMRREGLPPGWQREGPCIIDEVDSSIYVPRGDHVECDRYGNLLLTVGGIE